MMNGFGLKAMKSDDEEEKHEEDARTQLSVKVCLWEFGQNDPKR